MNRQHNQLRLWFDRLLSRNMWKQFLFLAIVLLAVLGLSYLLWVYQFGDEWQAFCDSKGLNKWLLPIYLLIDSNALNNLYFGGEDPETGKALTVSGGLLLVATLTFLVGAIVFNGIIIGIITNSIDRRVANHKSGRIHYLKSGHFVIMGYDKIVPSIMAHIFRTNPEAYILILSSEDSEQLRERLHKLFGDKQMEKVIVNYGFRTSENFYGDIHLERAEMVYIAGDRSMPAHDAMNVECVDSICNYLEKLGGQLRPKRITCVFEALDTYAAFKTSEIFRKVRELNIEFVPYNSYAGWAKQVFVKREYSDFDNPATVYKYPLVYGKGIKPGDDRYVHLVFVGTTNFAVAFAMEAAHVLHFPNADRAKTRITFIDGNADKEKEEFITRNRHFFEVQPYYYQDLTNEKEEKMESQDSRDEYVIFQGRDRAFLDVEFEFIKGNVFSKRVQDEIRKWANEHRDDRQWLSIFLALADQRQNFVMGMNMPDEVYDNEVPVFIRQDRSDIFVTNLRNADQRKENERLVYSVVKDGAVVPKKREARYAHIYPFGMNETAFSADNHSLTRAKLINYLYETANYETYKFQGILTLDAIPEEKIWEEADAKWQKLSVALKWSNLYNSYTMRTKQRTLRAMRGLDIDDDSRDYDTLTDDEADRLAIVEHNRWNVEKLLMGFRKPRMEEDKYVHPAFVDKLKKNKDLFIHHDIRPFDQLNAIRELDREFSRYIPWIMKMTEQRS